MNMKKALCFFTFLLALCFLSCSDSISGINVVNKSFVKTEFKVSVKSGIWEYSDKKTLDPDEIWNLGFAQEPITKKSIEGDYYINNGTVWFKVEAKRGNEYIVIWDGTSFRLE
jgi:hypothetical protein